MNEKNKSHNLIYNDESSLVDHLYFFWQRKLIIITTLCVSLLAAYIYIYYQKPVYELEGILSSPTRLDMEELNYQRSQGMDGIIGDVSKKAIPPLDREDVYSTFTKNLLTNSSRSEFLAQKKANKCDQSINTLIIRGMPQIEQQYLIKIKSSNPHLAQQCITSYLKFLEKKSTTHLLKLIDAQNKRLLKSFQNEILVLKRIRSINTATNNKLLAKRNTNFVLNKDNKTKNDAIAFIEYKDLNPTYFKKNSSKKINDKSGDQDGKENALNNIQQNLSETQFNDINEPYLLYQKLLENQLNSTKARYLLYKQTMALSNQIKPIFFHLNDKISISNAPVWPNKKLILLLGIFSGLIVGLTIVLLQKTLMQFKFK